MVHRIDFRALFGVLPSPHMILDRDLRYAEVNDAYLKTLDRTREELLGRNMFEVFPNDGEGGRMLRASFQRVISGRIPDSIAYIPYPIARRNGGMEMRYWSAVHLPLLDDQGEVLFIVQNTVDVTEIHHLKEIAYGPGAVDAPRMAETQLLQRAEELQEINVTLLAETAALRDLFMQAPGFMAVVASPSMTFTFVNDAFLQVVGARQLIGRTVYDALPELADGWFQPLKDALRTREPFVGRSMSIHVRRHPDSLPEQRFVDFVFQPILDDTGEAVGVFVEGSDVTDRVRGELQQKLLVDELNHRVKNSLATVQSIAAQTLRNTPEPEAFRRDFEARLLALSATHDLLTATSWRSAGLRDVVLVELRPHGSDRYRLSGPEIQLAPADALSLGLIFHELATNAAKYGGLSDGEGRVEVAWRILTEGAQPELELEWVETGGPPVVVPSRRGFGSRLIERSLEDGSAALTFAAEGLRCSIRLPLRRPAEPQDETSP